MFPHDPGVGLAEQPSYIHGEVWFQSDTRDHRGHPSRGGLYRVARTTFHDRQDNTFSFGRYDVEGLQLVPLKLARSVIALHAMAAFTDLDDGQTVPFYLLPSLGGHNTLRGYTDYRFHDRHLLAVNVESRWLLFNHVDGVAFVDAGNVAARAKDLDLGKRTYGIGVRVHADTSTFVRLDAGHGTEGWHVMLKLTDPFRLARLSRVTAAIPFVP
jgi:outer membrane protein assembly factor BamA